MKGHYSNNIDAKKKKDVVIASLVKKSERQRDRETERQRQRNRDRQRERHRKREIEKREIYRK